jgi:hypothetical protein
VDSPGLRAGPFIVDDIDGKGRAKSDSRTWRFYARVQKSTASLSVLSYV